jgi:hypothetical protein
LAVLYVAGRTVDMFIHGDQHESSVHMMQASINCRMAESGHAKERYW